MEKLRFDAKPESIHTLMNRILVVCSGCGSRAVVLALGHSPQNPTPFQTRRVICGACGYSKEWCGSGLAYDWNADPVCEPFFNLSLWLQLPCAGHHLLWAFNERHLNLLESYVGAVLRETYTTSTRIIPEALPEWMIVAKHRDEVLRGIQKLKNLL
jgi:ribosomal protein S27AE